MKILCLGNNGTNTDRHVSLLSDSISSKNNGLVDSPIYVPSAEGFYHTSLADMSLGDILNVAKNFTKIVFLDQPYDEWTSWKLLLSTYKLCVELEANGHIVEYKNNKNIAQLQYFEDLVKTNKSFCIYPWINFIEEQGKNVLCARSSQQKVCNRQDAMDNWPSAGDYPDIRNKMLTGIKVEDHCNYCYELEAKGIESYRQFETKDWAAKLNLKTIEDVKKLTYPHYYEIRLSNKCNLMCRGCKPEWSHLIAREFSEHNINFPLKQVLEYSSLDVVDISTLNSRSRVYLTGGEPTVMSEVYQFMRECAKRGNTSFDFTLGTNAQAITPAFVKLCQPFTNMNFAVSLDGYGKVNDYWRWNSHWDTIIRNVKLLEQNGHNISINIVPGIYNVTNLHLLYEFLDKEFPMAGMYLQINHNPWQSAFNHPNRDLVIESMTKCQQTNMYLTDGKSNRTTIDSIKRHYQERKSFDQVALGEFFKYNDKLDKARGSKLGDYIPELEECRSLAVIN